MVICVHWFNPFVYRMEKEVNRACELSCDESVISALNDRARREYGEMLIQFIKIKHHKNNSIASVTLTEGAEQLKERLGAIMKFRKKTKLIAAISVITAVLLSAGGSTIGAYVAQSGAKQSSSDGETDYKSILSGRKAFICTDWANNKRLNIEEIGQVVTDEDGITVHAVKFAKSDLDGDGEDEVILWLRVNDFSDYGFEVLVLNTA